MNYITISVLGVLIGFLFGMVLIAVFDRIFTPRGTLKIDCSNPEKDVYSLDVGDIDKIKKHKRYILKVQIDSRN